MIGFTNMGFSPDSEETLMNELYTESPDYTPSVTYTQPEVTIKATDQEPEKKKPFPWWWLLAAYAIYEYSQ